MREFDYGISVDGGRVYAGARLEQTPAGPRAVLRFGAANPDATEFEADVIRLLQGLEPSPTATAVMGLLGSSGHRTVIYPVDPAVLQDARTGGIDWRRGIPAGVVQPAGEGSLMMPGDDSRTAAVETAATPLTGLGGGSDAFIAFHPAVWQQMPATSDLGRLSASAALLHELVHALRLAHGHQDPRPFAPADVGAARAQTMSALFDNPEELYALTVEGIYNSEAAAAGIRGSHSAFDTTDPADAGAHIRGSRMCRPGPSGLADLMERDLGTATDPSGPGSLHWVGPCAEVPSPVRSRSRQFARDIRVYLLRFVREERRLCDALRRVVAPFNPIRDLAETSH